MENMEEDVYQNLLNQGYTEDQIQMIMELGLLPEQLGQVGREQEIAEGLRQTPSPEGRHVSRGRVYKAAHPMEFAGGLAQRYMGERKQKQEDAAARAIANEQVQSRIAFLRGGRPPATPQGTPPLPTMAPFDF